MSDLVEVIGLGFIAAAAFVVALPLGLLVAGLALLLVAQGLDGSVSVAILRELVVRAVAAVPRRRRESA